MSGVGRPKGALLMKRWLSALLTLILLCACAAVPASAEESDTITIIDHAGYEVVLPKEINRIVTTSIYPFASVVTMYLGSAEKLVGIHPVSYSAAVNSTLGKIFSRNCQRFHGFYDRQRPEH